VLAEPSAVVVLSVELGDFHNPPEVRAACLRAMAATDPERGDGFAAALIDDPSPPLRDAAVRVLGRSADGAKRAARRLLSGKLPADVRGAVIDALSAHAGTDPEAADLLRRVQGR
jgi:HEAT repeat protein